VTSPLPNSGKTTLLRVISFLVRNGLSSVSITGAALFRSIEKWAPTIAIDEADTAFVNNERGALTPVRLDPTTNNSKVFYARADVIALAGGGHAK
jgi:hypothetical protein